MTRYLNRSAIEWTDLTWNPIVGCRNACPYCYAEALCRRFTGPWGRDPEDPFKPEFYTVRLTAPLKHQEPARIFVCSMGELWGPWVLESWRNEVLRVIDWAEWHTFLNLTKNPEGIRDHQYHTANYIRSLPRNLWVGVSVDTVESLHRLTTLREEVGHPHKFVSFEPLLGDVAAHPDFSLEGIDWVIIGAQTGPGAEPVNLDWVYNVGFRARAASCPLFIKDNVGLDDPAQEFPEGFQ